MGIQSQVKEIDGQTWEVSQLPGMRALKMFRRLGNAFGPCLAKMLSNGLDIKQGRMNLTGVGEAVGVLFERLSEAVLESIVREFLGNAVVDGKVLFATNSTAYFDTVMAGRTPTVLKALAFAIEVNYGSFFDVLRGLVNSEAVKALNSTSPITSEMSGQRGDST